MGCSGDVYRKIGSLLRQHGAKMRKSKKHRHWVFPNGGVWIVPNSPKSDSGYYRNLADLKKYLRFAPDCSGPAGPCLLTKRPSIASEL